MNKLFKFILASTILVGFSVVGFSQEIKIRGPLDASLKGGYKFNNLQFKISEECSSFFIIPVNKPVLDQDIFTANTTFKFSSIFGARAEFTGQILNKDIYYTPNYGYKIFPEVTDGPEVSFNVKEGSSSVLKNIVFIPSQTKQFVSNRVTPSHVDCFDPIRKTRQVELPDGSIEIEEYDGFEPVYPVQVLTLLGFFYVLEANTDLEDLCTILEIPYVKTLDKEILVPVGGKKATVTRWMLKTFYGINNQAKKVTKYTF